MNILPLSVGAALVLSLGLVACGTSTTGLPSPDPAGLTNKVSGTISDWTYGAGTIEAQARPTPSDASTYVKLSSATVNADGTFSLTLPTVDAVTPYLNTFQQTPRTGCTGVFTQSVKTARQFSINTYALKKSDGSVIGYLVENNPDAGTTRKVGDYYITHFYADQAFTATGTLDCPDSKITLSLNLKQGWNTAVTTTNAVSTDGKATAVTIRTVAKLPVTKF
ncbi:hypothetical protein E7T09_04060 [Deinococcus sp. KSM4-11]|uniref:hypothetical protein n=1 Tax=Deinococcus sp. KSM4-11 TaxID=2568654 RepID=UPI0010A4C461|nr:hypothetical protein [Deinococcus sp. KSM4-11]THF88388.1 hypothetical protein E7T09_04060 [Deinococcus sp. KSM4-11]